MGLNIVDADIKDLKEALYRGRVRSAETKALVEAIDSLTPGKAKAISFAPGQDASKSELNWHMLQRLRAKS